MDAFSQDKQRLINVSRTKITAGPIQRTPAPDAPTLRLAGLNKGPCTSPAAGGHATHIRRGDWVSLQLGHQI
jgi:hypothetical protein